MGRKHSKNAGVMGSEALTYHERRLLGHGTATERLGKVGGRASTQTWFLAFSQSSSAFMWSCVPAGARLRERDNATLPSLAYLAASQRPQHRCCPAFAVAQDSIGNYYDCRLTLAPAVVRTTHPAPGMLCHHPCCAAAAPPPCLCRRSRIAAVSH